jgi:hypothetical protein
MSVDIPCGRAARLASTSQPERLSCVLCAAVFLLSTSCAAVFREPKATIHVSSDPSNAVIDLGGNTVGTTPGEAEVPRQGLNIVNVKKRGYEQSQFVLDRSMNTGWLVWDVATCVIPVMLCIPLLVDGVSGAWIDVEGEYSVTLTRDEAAPADSASKSPSVPTLPSSSMPAGSHDPSAGTDGAPHGPARDGVDSSE